MFLLLCYPLRKASGCGKRMGTMGQFYIDANQFESFLLESWWVGAPQGSFGEQFFTSTESGFKMVFVNGLKWVYKWITSGFLGAKVGENGLKPALKTYFGPILGL